MYAPRRSNVSNHNHGHNATNISGPRAIIHGNARGIDGTTTAPLSTSKPRQRMRSDHAAHGMSANGAFSFTSNARPKTTPVATAQRPRCAGAHVSDAKYAHVTTTTAAATGTDRRRTRLNSSHVSEPRLPS